MTPHDLLSLSDDLDLFRDTDAERTDIDHSSRDVLIEQGLIPPLPITIGPNPALVWGWTIVRRAAELGVEALFTRTFHLNRIEALLLALQLQSRTGRYSWVEQEAMVSYLESASHGNTVMGTEAGGVDWHAVSQTVRGDGALVDLVGRYRKLGPSIRALVNNEFISLKTAERIVRVPGEFLGSHHRRLDSLSFSARRQFLELLAELIVQAPGTEADAVSAVCVRGSAALDQADPLNALRRWRYPALAGLEDQFREIRRASLHGTGVELEAPPYFEGDSYTVSFRFRDCVEFEERSRALQRLKGSCDQLFGIL